MSVSSPRRATLRDVDRFQLRLGEPDDLTALGEIDADAGALFEEAGMYLDLPDDHEFPVAERRRWRECLAARTTLIMVDRESGPIGFAAIGRRDGEHYLAQLSVRRRFMRLGLGGALLEAAGELLETCGARALWLTTYNHLPWNRPFYEQHGFAIVAARDCGRELLLEHAIEQRWLPMPQERVVMRRLLGEFAR